MRNLLLIIGVVKPLGLYLLNNVLIFSLLDFENTPSIDMKFCRSYMYRNFF